jgi:arginine decarboxylase-like protein
MEGKYRILFYEIIDQILHHLTKPFSKTEKKNKSFGLLDCEKFDVYKLKCNISHHIVCKLIRVYEDEFDSPLPKN